VISTLSSVFDAAASDTRTAEWGGVYMYLPDAVWTQSAEGKQLQARSWKTLLNDPHMQAIAGCLVRQILGDGLWFRSQFGAVPTQAVRETRKKINRAVAAAAVGTTLDAGGMLTQPDLDAQQLLGGFFGGNGWAVRCFKSGRPGAAQSSCWRVIDADRVQTPSSLLNRGDVVNGVQYQDRAAVGIWVRDWEPAVAAQYYSSQRSLPCTYYPLIGADGLRQVIHFAPMRWRAGSDLGVPALAAGLVLAHQLKELFRAHVSGKRIQASHPIAIEVQNPAEAAAAYQEAVEAGTADADAQILFVPKGGGATFTNAQYNGSDFAAVIDVYLRALCAAIGYPWQFVLMQLQDANMAAAQAALDQADQSSAVYQRQWIEQVQRHRDAVTIREAWARGDLGAIAETQDLYAGDWQRPRRSVANRLRAWQAVEIGMRLGLSPSTGFDELGHDFEMECERGSEDRSTASRTGAVYPPDILQKPSGAGDAPTPSNISDDDPPPAPGDLQDDADNAKGTAA
jgi:capsid protein